MNKFLFLALTIAGTLRADQLIYAEGEYYTTRPSAEHVVVQYARDRMYSDATGQCHGLGYVYAEPAGAPSCSASYADRAWSAFCSGRFYCR